MTILSTVSVATLLGMYFLDARVHPLEFVYYWLIVLVMLAWLLGIAWADVRHTLILYRQRNTARTHVRLEQYLRESRAARRPRRGDPP